MNLKRLLIAVFFCCIAVFATAQEKCEDAVKEASKYFEQGKFMKIFERLDSCYKHLKDSKEKIEARKLRAKSYIAIDSIDKAKREIEMLFRLKPDYETAYGDAPFYIDLVNEVRADLERRQTSSVSKRAENIELTPATMSVITAEDIENRGYQDLEALFHDVSGFDISRSMGITYSNIYQRGYRSAAATDRTLLLVDGVEDNELWTNFAWISRQYALSNIKRVEIIHGPASTIYGANAFLGVVNIVTKREFDYFDKTYDPEKDIYNKLAVNAHVGYGSYNTKYTDISAAARYNKMFFSLTTRFYQSDEMDLSGYDDWNYTFNNEDFNDDLYNRKLSITGTDILGQYNAQLFLDNNNLPDNHEYYSAVYNDANTEVIEIVPTTGGINKARELDGQIYNNEAKNNGKLKFLNPTDDIDIHAKLKVRDFTIGFQWFNRKETMTPTYTDLWLTGALGGSVWNVEQYFMYMKYDKYINDKLNISSFTRYKVNGIYPDNRVTDYHGYVNGVYSMQNLLSEDVPFWRTIYLYEASKQLRTELKFVYHLSEFATVVTGFEFRNSSIPGNYVISFKKDSILDGISPNVAGGNVYTSNDIGAYAQLSYMLPVESWQSNIHFTAGARVDNNAIRIKYGYGTVFNPRLAAVFAHRKFIFKLIYAEAFKDASNFNKFSTSTTRLLSNPKLEPEKVKNFDVNFRWRFNKNFYAEMIYYNARYTKALETAIVDYKDTKTTQFKAIGNIDIQGLQINSEYNINRNYSLYANYTHTSPYKIEEDDEIRIGDIANHQINFGANGKFFANRLNVNVRANFVGAKETGKNTTVSDNPYSEIGSYTIFHGAIKYNDLLPGLSLQLIVNNMFDTEYFHPGIRSADGVQYAGRIPQYGRSVFVRVLYELKRSKR